MTYPGLPELIAQQHRRLWCVRVDPDAWLSLQVVLARDHADYFAVRCRGNYQVRDFVFVIAAGGTRWDEATVIDPREAARLARMYLHLRREGECVLSPGWRRVLAPQRQAVARAGGESR